VDTAGQCHAQRNRGRGGAILQGLGREISQNGPHQGTCHHASSSILPGTVPIDKNRRWAAAGIASYSCRKRLERTQSPEVAEQRSRWCQPSLLRRAELHIAILLHRPRAEGSHQSDSRAGRRPYRQSDLIVPRSVMPLVCSTVKGWAETRLYQNNMTVLNDLAMSLSLKQEQQQRSRACTVGR